MSTTKAMMESWQEAIDSAKQERDEARREADEARGLLSRVDEVGSLPGHLEMEVREFLERTRKPGREP